LDIAIGFISGKGSELWNDYPVKKMQANSRAKGLFNEDVERLTPQPWMCSPFAAIYLGAVPHQFGFFPMPGIDDQYRYSTFVVVTPHGVLRHSTPTKLENPLLMNTVDQRALIEFLELNLGDCIGDYMTLQGPDERVGSTFDWFYGDWKT